MATKTRRRVRKNMGGAAQARGNGGRDPQGARALVPNFDRGEPGEPQCLALAEGGIRTASDMIRFNGALITDILRRRIPAADASQINGANRNTLRAADLQHRFGREVGPNGERELRLDAPPPNAIDR